MYKKKVTETFGNVMKYDLYQRYVSQTLVGI